MIPATGGAPRKVVRFEYPTRDVYDYALGDGKVDFGKIRELITDYTGPISVEIEFDGK